MRYKVIVSYNGSNYNGWQKQPNVASIQGEIEDKLSTIFNEPTIIHGSGRTDAGVHAKGQVFHFDQKKIATRKLCLALNRMLPDDIKIIRVNVVTSDFHARLSAKHKTYEYIVKQTNKDVFAYNQYLFSPINFDVVKLQLIANLFLGTHDFRSFTSKKEDFDEFVRTIHALTISKRSGMTKFIFKGDGFMQGQIRFIVGTIIAVYTEKIPLSYISNRLDTKRRDIVSYKVSGKGLYLIKVNY